MENKEELEKLVEEFRGGFWSTTGQTFIELKQKQDKYLGDLFARIRVLAYKQGYMRGKKETLLRVVDDLYNVPPTGTVHPFDMIKAIEQYRQKLDKEAQAHDAISKLKEKV